MKQKILSLIIILISISTMTGAQTLPRYSERKITNEDSIKTNLLISATEGSINPSEYMVGPGDRLFISISGIEEISSELIVNHEGILYIPKVGGIDLNGINLEQSKEKIKSAINKYYKDVDVFISLIDFRKIRATLLGDVIKSSSYILNASSRLGDLISMSEGLNETANLRNITIKRRNGSVIKVDYLDFLRIGNLESNPFIQEGDLVVIDKTDKVVTISGEVKYPGTYEYVEGETITELIRLSGGVTSRAYTDSIEIVSFGSDGKTQYSSYYSESELEKRNIKVSFHDHIMVRVIPDYYIERYVNIDGFIYHPGFYKIVKDSTLLSEIIAEAGGVKEDASLAEASLIRNIGEDEVDTEFERLKLIPRSEMTDEEYDYLKAKSRERKGNVVVDFIKLMKYNDASEDVVLKRGDKIFIPQEKNYITLIGQVVNPGNIIYQDGLSTQEYIELAGGYGWRALEGDVRVIKAQTGEWVEEDDIKELEPGDTIWVPEDPPGPTFWNVFTTSLTIVSQVATVLAATIAIIVSTR